MRIAYRVGRKMIEHTLEIMREELKNNKESMTEMNPVCQANLEGIKCFLKEKIEGLWGDVRERDEILRGDLKGLEALIKSEFSAGRTRMERIEDWLKRQSEERKKLEERVRRVEGKVLWVSALTAGAVSGFLFGIQLLLSFLKIFPGH